MKSKEQIKEMLKELLKRHAIEEKKEHYDAITGFVYGDLAGQITALEWVLEDK